MLFLSENINFAFTMLPKSLDSEVIIATGDGLNDRGVRI
jgi:hypothetical protein